MLSTPARPALAQARGFAASAFRVQPGQLQTKSPRVARVVHLFCAPGWTRTNDAQWAADLQSAGIAAIRPAHDSQTREIDADASGLLAEYHERISQHPAVL